MQTHLPKLFALAGILFLTAPSLALGFDPQAAWQHVVYLRDRELDQSHTFLLSYPRCGNTWMRYCLEHLTRRPTVAFHAQAEEMRRYSLPLGSCDLLRPCIWKVHDRKRMDLICAWDRCRDRLICLVRNYKECLPRHLGNMRRFMQELKAKDASYFDNLTLYDTWEPSRRLLIYYEDFLAHPKEVLESVLQFLNEDRGGLEHFFAEFESHRLAALQFYEDYVGPSATRGEKRDFHSEAIPVEKRLEMDRFVQEKYPSLWDAYLSRYRE